MQNRLENTSVAFQRPANITLFVAVGSLVCLILLVSAVIAGVSQNWSFAALFGVAFLGSAAFTGASIFKLNALSSTIGQNQIEWNSAMPDLQRQSLNIEVRELSKLLAVEAAQISELQSAYIVAEDLALRQIQHEEGVPIMRHVSVSGVPFDAVFQKEGLLVCCEVAFLVTPELRQERIDAMVRKIVQAKRSLEKSGNVGRVRLMIALVTQLVSEDEDILRSALQKHRFGDTPVDIDIRLLDFEALQRLYVTE